MRWRFGQLPSAGLSAPSFRMLPDALAIETLEPVEVFEAFEAAFVLDFALAAFFGAAFLAADFFSAIVLLSYAA
jgi:hypothetical protein